MKYICVSVYDPCCGYKHVQPGTIVTVYFTTDDLIYVENHADSAMTPFRVSRRELTNHFKAVTS